MGPACPFCLRRKHPNRRISGAVFSVYCDDHILEQYISIRYILQSIKKEERNQLWATNYHEILKDLELEIVRRKLKVPAC